MKKTDILILTMFIGITIHAQTSLLTINGTNDSNTSAHLNITASGDDKAYFCPDEFSVLQSATLTTWGPEATCGAIPYAPMNLTATGMDEQVFLEWDANTEPDIVEYHIARGTEPTYFGHRIDGVDKNTTSYYDENVVNGSKYYYQIWVVDNNGNASPRSNIDDATPQDVDPPSKPENCAATPGDAMVTITWDDCPETDVMNYHIARSIEAGGFAVNIGSTDGDATEFIDTDVVNGTTYYYNLWASDEAGNCSERIEGLEATPQAALAVDGNEGAPEEFALYPAYPNPFNPVTTIKFDLPESGNVMISIYNEIGNLITILKNEVMEAGQHSIQWDSKNSNGQNVCAGIYLYRIETENYSKTMKMVFLK